MSSRQLIFNADDYGLSPAVSAGILSAMRQGAVRSTTVMANLVTGAELEKLCNWLGSSEGQELGCTAGCHLNLSCGPALLNSYPQELLHTTPDGQLCFVKPLALVEASWIPARLAYAAHEWELQLRSLISAGLTVSHLDSHHHVHLLRPLFPLALDLAQRYSLPLRTRREYRSLARSSGLATPDNLVEGFFGRQNISQPRLMELLNGADGEVVELMCHPGNVDNLLEQRSSYRAEREAELALLSDPALLTGLSAEGWQLSGYRWISDTEWGGTDCG